MSDVSMVTRLVTNQEQARLRVKDFPLPEISDLELVWRAGYNVGIDWDAATMQSISRCKIVGGFDVGLRLRFCMEAALNQINVKEALVAFHIGSGQDAWTDGTQNNSSSNVCTLLNCRAYMQHEEGVGFQIDGASGATFIGPVFEGGLSKYGWEIDTKHAWSQTTIISPWVENQDIRGAVIKWRGLNSTLTVQGMRMRTAAPLFLDMTGSTNSTVLLLGNCWEHLPIIKRGPGTVIDGMGNTHSIDAIRRASIV